MESKLYSMAELERLSGVKRRIIHFYVKERVISPPIGTKGIAKYTERQLLSLQLIKHLKKSHLKLLGIKETLEALSVEEMRSMLEKAEQNDDTPGTPPDKNHRYLRELKRNPAVNQTSWERFEIVKGLELNVSNDVMEKLGSRLFQWIEYLKKII